MSDELKSCPFCGHPPEAKPWERLRQTKPDGYVIGCSSNAQDCPANPSVAKFDKSEAIAAWNRRAPPVVTDEMVEMACKAALVEVTDFKRADMRAAAPKPDHSPEAGNKAHFAINGELVEIGDDESGQPRILIYTTRDAIKAHTENLLFKHVTVNQSPEDRT